MDVLKLLMCVGIILYHYCLLFCNNNTRLLPFNHFRWVFHYGWLGVDFFYLSAGYFIHYNYKNRIEKIKFQDFFLKRIKAIYPMYIAVVLLTLGLYLVDYLSFNNEIYHIRVNFWEITKSIFCIKTGWFDGDGSPYGMGMYFVNILFLCYIIYFLLAKRIKKAHQFIIVFFLLAIVGFVFMVSAKNIPFLYSRNGRGYMSFAIGVLLCEAEFSLDRHGGAYISYILIFIITILIFCIAHFGIEATLGNVWKSFAVVICPSIFFIFMNTPFILKIFSFPAAFTNKRIIGHYCTSLYFSASFSMVAVKMIAYILGIKDYYSIKFFTGTMSIVFLFSFIWDISFKIMNKDIKQIFWRTR